MTKLFISHSSQDDAFVREIRGALADHGLAGWIDSRELSGGDPIWSEIQKAIEESSAFMVVVSTDSLQSKWIGRELRYALNLQKQKGKDKFPVIPLSLNDTKLGVLEEFFDEEPLYIPVSSDAGGVEAAISPILVALGNRLPADVPSTPQPKTEPLEELVLKLTDLKFVEQAGVRHASARARLVYEPAISHQREVASEKSWRLVAPLGPIEADDLRWYLEKYAIWPSRYFQNRAQKVEENLIEWGKRLYKAAVPELHTNNVMQAWVKVDCKAGRRFSVHVDDALEDGAPEEDMNASREAATLLLGLPWELLHDDDSFLFQGAKATRVRRRLPNTRVFDVSVVATPIRILFITARPEDDAYGYIDHRVSALPLVETMESLPGLVKLHLLSPPTLPALRAELDRAREEKSPYHVVHFDGHGVYDRTIGLGGLCFEHSADIDKLENRRHVTVFTDELGPLLRDYRIPLIFLEACKTAHAEQASESVASELLKAGVASVVAMSHSVLVETARRFVEAFYQALADGKRVGDAMLAGQRQLKDDSFRGCIFGAGELRLEDWFVPLLFQEKDDPQLFKTTPANQTREDFQTALAARLRGLPAAPDTGFIGRSRELLALQRLLQHKRYAVVRGQGGEGKTALAAEFARWLVRSQQKRRAAFVSVETHSHVAAVLDALGCQLVGREYSVAAFDDLEQALLPVERALSEQDTLLVLDNMESILPPPFLASETSQTLSEDLLHELEEILKLCARLHAKGNTRLVFTSREVLPQPFNAILNRIELDSLDREDAVKLIERAVNASRGNVGATVDASREEIEQLVEAVHCHARSLSLLTPTLRERGIQGTRESLLEVMADMEKRFPGSRDKSLFASVELSLRRLSPANREWARALAVFHGGFHLDVFRVMMQMEDRDIASLAEELVGTGLATPHFYEDLTTHLTLNPALCPYQRSQLGAKEYESLLPRWEEAMLVYADNLAHEHNQDTAFSARITLLELPNFIALLDRMQQCGTNEATIRLTNSLFYLWKHLGKPRLLERLAQVRTVAATALGETWSHTSFEAQRTLIEQQLDDGRLDKAFNGANELLQRAQSLGRNAYPLADYDLAYAHWLVARSLPTNTEEILSLLEGAIEQFDATARRMSNPAAEGMAAVCCTDRGDCLAALGLLDKAAFAYEEGIRRAQQLGDDRQVAVGIVQLGTVRRQQHRFQEALSAFEEGRERFSMMNEPATVATLWRETGIALRDMNRPESAEDAFRESLKIYVRLRNGIGQARTLNLLGILYDLGFDRLENAVSFFRQAADKFADLSNCELDESASRSNLAEALHKLGRLEQARQEILRAIDIEQKLGDSVKSWRTWDTLAAIEMTDRNPIAAMEAKRKAIECYLAYRRGGGENYYIDGRISLAVTEYLLAGNVAAARLYLQRFAADPEYFDLHTFIEALQAIISGKLDRSFADAPDVHPTMAAEILFLIETLEKRR